MTESEKSAPGTAQNNQPKTILVAVDFSAASRTAFTRTLDLAGNASRIILLHVVAPSSKQGELSRLTDAARESLISFSRSNGADHDHAVGTIVRSGPPFQEILAAAEEENAELIVVAVHAAPVLAGLALGHTVDRVSRYARCPVLLVREDNVVPPGKEASIASTLSSRRGQLPGPRLRDFSYAG